MQIYEKNVQVDVFGSFDLNSIVDGLLLYSIQDCNPSPNIVYFCKPEDLANRSEKYNDIFVVCINNSAQPLYPTDDSCPLIVFNTNYELQLVFNLLSKEVTVPQNISNALYKYILEKRDVQETILLGESLMTNAFMLLDSNFKLRGYSRNRKCDNQLYNDTIAEGSLDIEVIIRMISENILMTLKKNNEILLKENNLISDAPIFIRQLSGDDRILGYGMLICALTPPMPGMLKTFSTFIDAFDAFLKNDKNNHDLLYKNQYEFFLPI
jgi:hypothetical protein